MQYDLIKVSETDPTRCSNLPCRNKAIEGATLCPKCGGPVQLKALEKKSLRTYNLSKYRARLDEFSVDPNIKGLREEIGILRIVLEEKMNSCQTNMELLASAHIISDMCVKIEKLVSSCQRLEKSMGNHLDKTQVTQLGMEIVQIIGTHVTDSETIDAISKDLLVVIERMSNESE